MRWPPIRNASTPSTYSRVTPYLKARGPPAFSATLPPSAHCRKRVRIGRVEQPLALPPRGAGRRARPRARPPRDVSRRSISLMRFIPSVESTMPPATGTAPPVRPVPPAARRDRHLGFARDRERGEDVLRGSPPATTASGTRPSASDSSRETLARLRPVSTFDGPSRPLEQPSRLVPCAASARGLPVGREASET